MKRVCLLRRAFQRDMNVSKTEIIVFLKVLIINSSKFIKTSSELISTRSELISTRSELNSTSSELNSTVAEQKKGASKTFVRNACALYIQCASAFMRKLNFN